MKSKFSLVAFLVFILAGCAPSRTTPAPIPPELSLEEHPLARAPEAEYSQLYFAESTPEGILAKHAQDRSDVINLMDRSCTVDDHFGQCALLGADKLVAWDEYGLALIGSGRVTVTRNGNPIYKIAVGDSSPLGSLRGLWTYAGHWALETANVKNHRHGNEIDSEATGQVSIDGQLLNTQLDYQEAFGFQTMHGRPFYFFKRDGKIGMVYDGVEIPTGYDEVPHYRCCSGATLNPRVAQNMVAFFARKGSAWYYIEVGVFNLPTP